MIAGLNCIGSKSHFAISHCMGFFRQEAGISFSLMKKKPKNQGLFLCGSKTTSEILKEKNSLRSDSSSFFKISDLFFHAPSQRAGVQSVLTSTEMINPTIASLSPRPSELSEEVNKQSTGPIWKLCERSEFFQIPRSEVYAESSAGLDFFASFFDQAKNEGQASWQMKPLSREGTNDMKDPKKTRYDK